MSQQAIADNAWYEDVISSSCSMGYKQPSQPPCKQIDQSRAADTLAEVFVLPSKEKLPRLHVINHIKAFDREYSLKRPLYASLELHDGLIFVDYQLLSISGYGFTLQEAVDTFAESFHAQWRHLVERSEDGLCPSALVVREHLRKLVE